MIPIVHTLPLTVQPHHTVLLQSQWLLRRSSEVAQAALSLSHVLPEGSISMIRFNFRTLRNNIPRLILLRVQLYRNLRLFITQILLPNIVTHLHKFCWRPIGRTPIHISTARLLFLKQIHLLFLPLLTLWSLRRPSSTRNII